MKKSDIGPMPQYYERYIGLVADSELSQAFDDSSRQLDSLDKSLLSELGGKTYAPGKWTVKGVLQHVIDWERILSYRALLFARGEGADPQDVDGVLLAANMKPDGRAAGELIEELKTVRASTKAMFDSFDEEMLLSRGISWKYELSVLAMGFTIIGHQTHHLKIIDEKYLPLLEQSGAGQRP